jgi:MobA/MobL family
MYRFNMKSRGRLSSSASALQHIAYILRNQEGPEAEHVAYLLRQSEATRGREDLMASGHGNLPSWANDSAIVFWEAAERFERANGRTATTWEVTLPRELTREEQLAAIGDLMHAEFGTRHPYVWALHEKRASDGGLNPHIHVAFSSRTMDGMARTPAQFFKRYNAEAPERGGARKDHRMHARGALLRQRQTWADIANWHLERGGHSERLDARSLEAQGIARTPTHYLPARDFTLAHYAHVSTAALQEREQGLAARQATWAEENERAVHAWEQRKELLGLTRETTHDQFLAQLRAAPVPERVPERDLVQHTHDLTQRLAGLRAYETQLAHARTQEQGYTARRWEPPLAVRAQSERVLAEARTHGLAPDLEAERAVHVLHAYLPTPDIEDSLGRAPRGRVFDRERRPPRDGYER